MIPAIIVMNSTDADMTIEVSEFDGGQILKASLDEKQTLPVMRGSQTAHRKRPAIAASPTYYPAFDRISDTYASQVFSYSSEEPGPAVPPDTEPAPGLKLGKHAWLPPAKKPAQSPLNLPTKKGSTVIEPETGSIIESLSDTWGWAHDYSISSPENADGTLLMLHNNSTSPSDMSRNQDIIVNADTLDVVRDMGYSLGPHRRWASNDPDTLYTLGLGMIENAQNVLYAYHPSSDEFEVVFDFTALGYTRETGFLTSFGQGGGVIDWQDKYAPITVANSRTGEHHMIVLDIQNKSIYSRVNWDTLLTREAINIPESYKGTPIPDYDNEKALFTLSRDGNYCLVFRGGDGSDAWPSMLEVYSKEWTNRREVGALRSDDKTWATMHISHAVTGVDQDGRQVLINEQWPDQGNFVDLETLEFVHFPHGEWGHLSVSKGLPGYAAHYGYSSGGSAAIVLAPLRKTGIKAVHEANSHGLPIVAGAPVLELRQYGFHRSVGTEYDSQPQTALTTRGDKLYFRSNQSGHSRGYRVKQ